ncbi:copper amine oxidase [Zopfochytrium polystomum]|nr:copper amine oxidase [Zopfochytrium polystomum]
MTSIAGHHRGPSWLLVLRCRRQQKHAFVRDHCAAGPRRQGPLRVDVVHGARPGVHDHKAVAVQIGLDFGGSDANVFKVLAQRPDMDIAERFPVRLEDGQDRPGRKGKQGVPLDSKKGQVAVSPDGARYSVDAANRYVSWKDWTFYIATDGPAGWRSSTSIWGNNPSQLSTVYLDSYYGFGWLCSSSLKGTMPPAAQRSGFVNKLQRQDLHPLELHCPISQHLHGWYALFNKVLSTKDISLVASYNTNAEDNKGFRIHDALHGSMHDHVMHIKVDLDVAGDTASSLETIDVVQMDAKIPES